MVNDILNNINAKLLETFGDSYELHNNELKQGFTSPCFFILLLNSSSDLVIGTRYQEKHTFDIRYHAKSQKTATREMNDVAEKLEQVLEYITVNDDLIRGTNMHYEKQDDVLHFFIDYDMFVFKHVARLPLMESLTQKQHLKGD